MCGRYTLHSKDRIELKGLVELELPFAARYNIAPGQNVLVIGDFGRGLEERLLRWGLIPSWSTDGKGFINARAETLEERPSFSESFRLRRCLIPADGFFEWKRAGREKQPYYLRSGDDKPLLFAGIWDSWWNQGELVRSCAIITTEANPLVGELHNRMPAILAPEVYRAWLDRRTNRAELWQMVRPFPAEQMKTHPVGSGVNSPGNDAVDLIAPVDLGLGQTMSLF